MVDEAGTPDTNAPTQSGESTTVVEGPRQSAQRAATLAGTTGGVRYRLGSQIGKGGQGEIIGAIDEQIGREVAVKRMRERHPTQHSMSRFFREACIQGRLDHPAIVPVHELGVDEDGRPFFTMKKLAGTTLGERIASGYPRQRLLRAFADVCLAIEFAHSKHIVHRDLKPQNIVLGDFGEVYVLDWGVAKMTSPSGLDDPDEPGDASTSNEQMTADGTIIGTRGYMAPEQAAAAPDVDGRADVYALGCVLFEILAGEALHRPDARTGDARPSTRAIGRDIPPELDALCVAATHVDRDKRIQTPRELGERVERFLDGDRDLATRQQLARTHLDAARVAFAAGDSESERRTAMREAGRALALDPKLAGAGELVGRLMLEPPREKPPDLQKLIDADDMETLRRMARAGARGYIGFLSFLPLVAAGEGMYGYLAALCLILALNCWLLLADRLYSNLKTRAILVVLGNTLLIGLLARMGSPFLIAPAVAALAAMGLVFSPTYSRWRAAVFLTLALAGAVLLPWIAETLGYIEPTMAFTASGLELAPPMLALSELGRYVFLGGFVVAIIGAGASVAYQNRKAARIVQDRIHLQAWQLRQLVS